ncbi:DUF4097 family beta strand repeat-containing protein [Rhodohalobacter sp.]|uniref:DUF4097 family beta strand repeat-containing protein n=1 Tax=Rhodohalobacter sp. TaxID=1974210 RepID=UPI003565E8BC
MTRKITHLLLTLVMLLFCSLSAAFAQSEQDAYRVEVFNSNDLPELDISTSGGFISVLGHDENEVKVVMYVKRGNNFLLPSDHDLSDFEIDISKFGNRVTASVKRKSGFTGFFRNNNISISFEVHTPMNSTVEGNTSGGSLRVENIHNNVNMRTSGGSVNAKDLTGNIALRTSGGSIFLKNLDGIISASTSGGSLNIDEVFGTSELSTSGGSIRISDSGGKLSARTSGGSIRADLEKFSDDIELRTSGGNINITLPQSDHFNMELSGFRVNTELRNFTGQSERNSISGRVGNGGPLLVARTSGGSVSLVYQ